MNSVDTKKPFVLFRADGNEKLGFGHIRRCAVVGRILAGKVPDHDPDSIGFPAPMRVEFLCESESFVAGYLAGLGFKVNNIPLSSTRDRMMELTLEGIKNLAPGVVALDIRKTRAEFIRSIQALGIRVASLDDLGTGGAALDALIGVDIELLAHLLPEEVKARGDWKKYSGLEYAIVDPDLGRFHAVKQKPDFSGDRILVTFGGSDPWRITLKVMEILMDSDVSLPVDAVFGPFSGDVESGKIIAGQKESWRVFHNPDNLAEIMARCRFAVCGIGQSAFELALMGTPCLIISQSPIHAGFADNFARLGCGIHLGKFDAFSSADLIKWCETLERDYSVWSRMGARAAELVDGKGAQRTAAVIASLAVLRVDK